MIAAAVAAGPAPAATARPAILNDNNKISWFHSWICLGFTGRLLVVVVDSSLDVSGAVCTCRWSLACFDKINPLRLMPRKKAISHIINSVIYMYWVCLHSFEWDTSSYEELFNCNYIFFFFSFSWCKSWPTNGWKAATSDFVAAIRRRDRS